MDVASVTLEEVLKAAQIRAASLVPEISGYLTLAIADASARLPFRIEDDMVVLSTEGTVKVMRGTDVVRPEESARVIRDILERLLASSIGSMQGLSQAARARTESTAGVPGVIGDLEGALVPVNRSAARRALARLAREVARARDRGRLDRVPTRRRPRAETPRKPAPPPEHLVAPEPEPAPVRASEPVRAAAHQRAEPMPVAQTATDTPLESIDVTFTEEPSPVEPVAEPHEPTPTIIATTLGEVEGLLLDRIVEDASRSAARQMAHAGKRISRGREADRMEKRSVDDLLQSFSVSSFDGDATMRSTQELMLKELDAEPATGAARPRFTLDGSRVRARS